MRQQTFAVAVFLGVLTGLLIHSYQIYSPTPIVYASEPEQPQEILIGTKFSKESIIKKIENTFPENPKLFVKIAKCESEFFTNAKNPKNNSHDQGIFQISKKHHGEEVVALNLDMFNVDDNLKYARILFERNGTNDWNSSKKCWNK